MGPWTVICETKATFPLSFANRTIYTWKGRCLHQPSGIQASWRMSTCSSRPSPLGGIYFNWKGHEKSDESETGGNSFLKTWLHCADKKGRSCRPVIFLSQTALRKSPGHRSILSARLLEDHDPNSISQRSIASAVLKNVAPGVTTWLQPWSH